MNMKQLFKPRGAWQITPIEIAVLAFSFSLILINVLRAAF
jgi:hypothetical protein